MSNRIYNVLFHTHTVSGLMISIALYVIFFAGSMSFFRDDIIAWEREITVDLGQQMSTNYDVLLDTLEARYGNLYGRDFNIRQPHQERNIMVSMEPSKDTLASGLSKQRVFTYIDTNTYEEANYFSSYTLGEFIYRLHFFAQIPYPYGYLLSGFVAFFFLFAIITGVIVHWKKIISNFYLFRPWAKLKTVWTDAHTALGLIGLPFQFVFAVTGAVLIIGTTVMLGPASSLIYKNDTNKMYRELMDQPEPAYFTNAPAPVKYSIDHLITQAFASWENAELSRLAIENYGDQTMRVIVEAKPMAQHAFAGIGRAIFDNQGHLLSQSNAESLSYIVGADQTMRRLHFGDFGGYGLRVIYFLFGIITCFVILTGVLIWVEARDKKSTTKWKRNANQWVASIFIAIALSMYPITALSFSFIKIFKQTADEMPHLMIYQFYFIAWLVVSTMFAIKRDNFFTTRYSLLFGALFGLLVPVVNGIKSGNWFWQTYLDGRIQIFVVDVFWMITSVIALAVFFRLKKPIALEGIIKPKATTVNKEHPLLP